MNKKCKELLKQNNRIEKQITKENDIIYTDMIVYIRGANLSHYNQELVRADLIQMILDGQQRGENIQQVIGGNYQEVCDEIIAALPQRSKKESICESIGLLLQTIWILGIIGILEQLIRNQFIFKHNTNMLSQNFTLTVGNIITTFFICIVSVVIVNIFCKKAFQENHNKFSWKDFLVCWFIAFVIFALIILCNYFFTTTVATIPIIWAMVAVALVFMADKLLENVG